MDFRFRTIKVEKKTVKLQIWDTAGQERFKTITSAYYRGADGIIIVYDVMNKDSFRHINDWLGEVSRYAPETNIKLIVGNKSDADEKVITTAMANVINLHYYSVLFIHKILILFIQELASSLGIAFVEASAKTGANVDEAFTLLTSQLIKQRSESRGGSSTGNSVTKLNSSNVESKNGKRSCC